MLRSLSRGRIGGSTRVTRTLARATLSGRRGSRREKVTLVALLVLGLIHANLKFVWLLDRLSKIHNKVVVDVVSIWRFAWVDGASLILRVLDPAGIVCSCRVFHEIRFGFIRTCVKSHSTACGWCLCARLVIFITLGLGRVHADWHRLIHLVLDVLAGWRFHLIEVDSVVLARGVWHSLTLHAVSLVVDI